jgi:pimeloyl-ACP methyl ester carboxylesterase/class 3 adenylate cyclase
MSNMPETRYAKSGDTYIAYQVMGDGPFDLIFVPGFVSHVEMQMELPIFASFFERLASSCRVIRFDKRGTGLSDRLSGIPTLEERMDDVRAVMDAAGSTRAALLGFSEGGPMCIVFSATYPQRVSALILYGGFARGAWAPDYPWRSTEEQFEAALKRTERDWGQGNSVDIFSPSLAHDDELRKFVARLERGSATPGAVRALMQVNHGIDVRHVLPTIGVPTLVLHRTGEAIKVENGRYLAQHIRSAKYVELPGVDHSPWVGDSNAILGEIEEFLTGRRREKDADLDRVLATVLFTDIVGSTARAVELGDHEWRTLRERHNDTVRQLLTRFRGHEVKNLGDGFLATFDGPARAVRCATAISDAVRPLGITVRSGLHTGEIELTADDVTGIAVHIAARVAAQATANETIVSSTVRDLVAGSGLRFEDRGMHALKGLQDNVHLYTVASAA